jgi:hypothetical protein
MAIRSNAFLKCSSALGAFLRIPIKNLNFPDLGSGRFFNRGNEDAEKTELL